MESPGRNPDCLGDNNCFLADVCKFRQILFFQTACHRLVEGRLVYNFSWECAKQVQASPHSCQLLTFICLREGVLDAFYLLQTTSKVISSDGLIYRHKEYYYGSGAVPGR